MEQYFAYISQNVEQEVWSSRSENGLNGTKGQPSSLLSEDHALYSTASPLLARQRRSCQSAIHIACSNERKTHRPTETEQCIHQQYEITLWLMSHLHDRSHFRFICAAWSLCCFALLVPPHCLVPYGVRSLHSLIHFHVLCHLLCHLPCHLPCHLLCHPLKFWIPVQWKQGQDAQVFITGNKKNVKTDSHPKYAESIGSFARWLVSPICR